MEETIRAFVAVELSEQVKNTLARLVDHLNAAGIRGVRPVRPDGIHLTLKFLGNIQKVQVESIVSALACVLEEELPFSVQLGSVGVFPNRSRPRVLWVGVDGKLEALRTLQGRVDCALASVGFAREKREFNPHLTIARIRDGTSNSDRQQAANALFSAGFDTGLPIDVEYVSLMSSTLLPQGAIHDCIAQLRVGANRKM